jgi:hypothetical protein
MSSKLTAALRLLQISLRPRLPLTPSLRDFTPIMMNHLPCWLTRLIIRYLLARMRPLRVSVSHMLLPVMGYAAEWTLNSLCEAFTNLIWPRQFY